MAKLPESAVTPPTVLAIYKRYEDQQDRRHRPHLGASQIGKECDRALWFDFRWCSEPKFDGRMLRLFDTGNREEARLVTDLRAIGIEVHEVDPNTGRQFRVSDVGGHFAGSLDGAGRGFAESSKWHVLEFKTSNAKQFAKLKKEGVEKAKPEHWTQMMVYMALTGMERAYYFAVCKDTDEIYGERVRYHAPTAWRTIQRAENIIRSPEPPARISEDPSFFVCNWCSHRDICHSGKVGQISCRTCLHATPEMDGEGRWSCALHGADIPSHIERHGCEGHRFIPALLPWRAVDASPEENWIAYEGGTKNGGDGMTSEELREVVNAGDQS